MIECPQEFPYDRVAFACRSHATQTKYETVFVPRGDQALKPFDKVRVYCEIGDDLAGIEPGAVWEDIKVGM